MGQNPNEMAFNAVLDEEKDKEFKGVVETAKDDLTKMLGIIFMERKWEDQPKEFGNFVRACLSRYKAVKKEYMHHASNPKDIFIIIRDHLDNDGLKKAIGEGATLGRILGAYLATVDAICEFSGSGIGLDYYPEELKKINKEIAKKLKKINKKVKWKWIKTHLKRIVKKNKRITGLDAGLLIDLASEFR